MVFVYKKGILEVQACFLSVKRIMHRSKSAFCRHKACLFDTMHDFCCHNATICQKKEIPTTKGGDSFINISNFFGEMHSLYIVTH